MFVKNAPSNLKLALSFVLKKCLDQDIHVHVGTLANFLGKFFCAVAVLFKGNDKKQRRKSNKEEAV